MFKHHVAVTMILLATVSHCFAKDLGVLGEIYPIVEVDLLEWIQSRITDMQHNGEWDSVQKKMQQDALHYRDRPKSIGGVTRAIENKSWLYDPSIVLDHDIVTAEGALIAKAGTSVNPLKTISLSKALVFYNADDPEQAQWAEQEDKKRVGRIKLILINGSLLKEEKRLQKQIYFDQEGRLVSRFGIKHVPAIVEQEGTKCRITEVVR